MVFFYKIVDLVAPIIIIISLILGIKHRNRYKNKILSPILIYIIISLINGIILTAVSYFTRNDIAPLAISSTINIFNFVEYSIFSYFLYTIITKNIYQRLIIIFYALYNLLSIIIWISTKNGFFTYQPQLYAIESLFLTISCLFYIFEILNSEMEIDFKTDPVFIVVCGILFYCSTMIPIFFFSHIIKVILPEFYTFFDGIVELFYILLFLTFIKAYLCQFQEQKLS